MNPHRYRTKSKLYSGSVRATTYYEPGPPITWQPWSWTPIPIKHHFSEMIDTTGFLQCNFNPCQHEIFDTPKVPGAFAIKQAAGPKWVVNILEGSLYPPGLLDAVRANLPVADDQYLSAFTADARMHFKTAVEDTHSLLNFIIELIELCEGNIVKAKELVDKIRKALKTFFEMYKKTGNYWLSWNFAIKPTIGDIKAILMGLQRAKQRLDWLRKRNHLDTKVKFRRQPEEFEGEFIHSFTLHDPNLPPIFPQPPIEVRCKYKGQYQYTASGIVRFDIPDQFLDETWGMGIVWSALNGLYNPLKVAWEAVPFSWLVDWFVNQKTKLQIEAANLSPLKDAEILQEGHAVKYNVDFEFELLTNTDRSTYVSMGQTSYIFYGRQPGLPDPEVFPFVVPFKWYNFSILAALAQQSHRRG